MEKDSVVGVVEANLGQDLDGSTHFSGKDECNNAQFDNDAPTDATIDIAIRQFVFLPPDEVTFPPLKLLYVHF